MTLDPVHYARRWKALGVLSLSLVIIGLDTTILNVALPTLQNEFDASNSKLQWMVDSYLLVFAGLLLVFGTLGDRLGRKLALQTGVSIFGLASLGALVADSADQVILVRAAMGVGAALIMPATLSIIANLFTGAERGKAIAIWAALAAVGIGLGPLIGGLLLEWFAWSSVFLVNVPFAVLALLLGIRYLPESRDPRPGSFDLPGAAFSTAGFSILVFAIIEAPERGWTSGVVVGSLVASVALLGAFLWWERRVDEPMLDLGFFRSARFSVGTAAVSVAFFALLGAIFALTQYLQFVGGYSAIEAGAIMSPVALGLMMGAGSSSKAVERLGVSRVVAAGLSGLALVLALTVLWEPDTNAWVLAAWFFGLALAMGWVMAPATEAVVGAVPAAKSGVASATNTVARMVSGALGVAVIGSLVSSLYSSDVGDSGSLDALPDRGAGGRRELDRRCERDRRSAPFARGIRGARDDGRGLHPGNGRRPPARSDARSRCRGARGPLPAGRAHERGVRARSASSRLAAARRSRPGGVAHRDPVSGMPWQIEEPTLRDDPEETGRSPPTPGGSGIAGRSIPCRRRLVHPCPCDQPACPESSVPSRSDGCGRGTEP